MSILQSINTRVEGGISRILSSRYSIDGEYKRIFFYHIRKTGGTSLINSVFGLGDPVQGKKNMEKLLEKDPYRLIIDGKVFLGQNRDLIEKGYYYFAHSHFPAHTLQLPDKTFTISVLRDPVKRVISHYNMLHHYKKINSTHPSFPKEKPWVEGSFDEFLERIPKEHLLRQLYMFSSNFDPEEAASFLKGVTFICLTNQLDDKMPELSNRLGYDIKLLREKSYNHQEEISDTDMAILRDIMEPEYRLLELIKHRL